MDDMNRLKQRIDDLESENRKLREIVMSILTDQMNQVMYDANIRTQMNRVMYDYNHFCQNNK